ARLLPTTATMDLLSLQLSDEINQELFEGLMLELPGQVNSFTEQISRFVGTLDKQALASAQRIAHTIKGSGNVVGVTGLANFMHFTEEDRKSTRLNSSHVKISYAVFCLKKKKIKKTSTS